MKHTPGPRLKRIGDNKTVFIENPESVGCYSEIDTNPYSATGLANAQLISAAPEMLGCLEKIRDAIEADVLIGGKNKFTEFANLMTILTQTIYKAKGEL